MWYAVCRQKGLICVEITVLLRPLIGVLIFCLCVVCRMSYVVCGKGRTGLVWPFTFGRLRAPRYINRLPVRKSHRISEQSLEAVYAVLSSAVNETDVTGPSWPAHAHKQPPSEYSGTAESGGCDRSRLVENWEMTY